MAVPPKKGAKPRGMPVSVVPMPVPSETAGSLCSICSSPLYGGESMVGCPHCKLPFHEECWKEIGGCGTYGCQAAPDLPKSEGAPRDEYQPGWAAEKTCPVCKSRINAGALKCRACHAVFPTERPMTAEEYQNREYEGQESEKMRNTLIALFILSAVGCLFWLSIPINIFHVLGHTWFFKVKRLPPALKVLFHAGLVVSLIWGILFAFILLFSR